MLLVKLSDVRIGVARRLPEIVEEIKLQASKDHILPIIDALVSDDSPEVRETMMEQVLSLCAVFDSVCWRLLVY